jgi:magnesium chelatase family protein
MISKIKTLTHLGLSVIQVQAECHIMNGQPVFNLVGMAEKSVSESKERIRVIINELGKNNKDIKFPFTRITINLSPAEIVKRGNQYDLAILLSMLAYQDVIPNKEGVLDKYIFLGELGLDGQLKKINNIVNYCLFIQEKLKDYTIFIPQDNALEASFLTAGNIYAVNNVHQIIDELNNPGTLKALEKKELNLEAHLEEEVVDLADIVGQMQAKRALEICAAGGHNLLMLGEAGSGKTLLSKAIRGIIPTLEQKELLEVAKIRSLMGLSSEQILSPLRPFRCPHHSASNVALLGGGKKIDAGEVTKAHLGILFLDELTEFDKKTIDSLRQPLEDKQISVARASGSTTYPCNFQLIATLNPSFSGGFENQNDTKKNSGIKKISGPILDRIDIQLKVFRPKNQDIINNANKKEVENSKSVRKRVVIARQIAFDRANKANSDLSISEINKYCQLDQQTNTKILAFIEQKSISMRSYHKILKVARTIADLDGSTGIELSHMVEALQYRF